MGPRHVTPGGGSICDILVVSSGVLAKWGPEKGGLSQRVGYRVGLPFCPLCSPQLLIFLSTGLALLVWWCCAAQYTHCGLGRKAGKGLAGRLGQPAPDWRVGGGLSRHRAPLFARPAGQLVWDFWEVFFPPFFLFFTLEE